VYDVDSSSSGFVEAGLQRWGRVLCFMVRSSHYPSDVVAM
jgi:hypothetical protein